MTRRILLPALAAALAACAPGAVVILSPDYESHPPRRVAQMGFFDAPGARGSGEIAATQFEKYLLWGGYNVIERRQVSAIMREQAFSVSPSVDPATIKKLGKILGVDALVLGSVTDFSNSRMETVMVDMPQERSDPVYGKVVTTQRSRDATVQTEQRVVTGYNYREVHKIVPETETLPAHVGLSARLVDVQTGEILWSASGASDGGDLNAAADQAAAAIMQSVVKQLKKAPPKP